MKVLHFLKAAPGVAPQDFRHGWLRAAEELLADASGPAAAVRRYEWNQAVPVPAGVAAYFGGAGQVDYDAYTAIWFDEGDALTGFRDYQGAIERLADKHGAPLAPSLCFVLFTREVVIFDDIPVVGGSQPDA